jgi:hypothetical protein
MPASRVLGWGACPWAQQQATWDGRTPICVSSCPSQGGAGAEQDVMSFVVQLSKLSKGLASVGFDFAGSQTTIAQDSAVWSAIENMKATGDAPFELIEGLLLATHWWSNYAKSVAGSAKSACQHDAAHRCIVYCIEGGVISQIEAKHMPSILEKVDLPPGSQTPEFAVRTGSLAEFREFVKGAALGFAMGGAVASAEQPHTHGSAGPSAEGGGPSSEGWPMDGQGPWPQRPPAPKRSSPTDVSVASLLARYPFSTV